MEKTVNIEDLTIKQARELAALFGGGQTVSAHPATGKYCVVRTYSAGVFFARVESREGKEAVLRDARRLWYWAGAASLSQLAVEGTKQPAGCKFPCAVDRIVVTEAIEILDTTEAARASLDAVPTWKQ